MLLVTGFATVSQIANHCHLSCYIINFVTLELTSLTPQDYVICINEPWKYIVTSSAILYLKILISTWGLPPRLGLGPPTS